MSKRQARLKKIKKANNIRKNNKPSILYKWQEVQNVYNQPTSAEAPKQRPLNAFEKYKLLHPDANISHDPNDDDNVDDYEGDDAYDEMRDNELAFKK